MKFSKLVISDFRRFSNAEFYIGNRLTAIAGNNGTGKSTVLGLLANSSQLSGHYTYLGKSYKGEFAELFSADPRYDPSGKRIELFYTEKGEKSSETFRTAWQNKKTRFRVIPKRKLIDGQITESKLESPVIYLGLSRLYPVGETISKNRHLSSNTWDVPEDEAWFDEQYTRILSIRDKVESVSTVGIMGLSRKTGTGIETGSYGPLTNSAGQDNLGQILMSVLSFKKLKRDLGNESWDGGLLLIDELDATLHPAAQLRLIKLLLSESKSVGFQVIFTTHSTTILEELSSKNANNPVDEPGDVEVAYLTDANIDLKVCRNPTWPRIENDLLVRSFSSGDSKVSVFSEDDEATWLIKQILEQEFPTILQKIDFVDCSFGCDLLKKLYLHDFLYIKDRIVVFDGDAREGVSSGLPKGLTDAAQNLVFLPGAVRPESVIHNYLVSLCDDRENKIWEELDRYSFNMRILIDNGPLSECYSSYPDDRNRFKSWFKDYVTVFEGAHVVSYWISDNPDEAKQFVESIVCAYNAIAKRTSAQEIQYSQD